LEGARRNIEGPAAEGGNCGPNTGGGGNNGPTPGGGTAVHVDDDTDESAFLPNGTPYSTKFYDKLISFGIQSSQVRMLMQNGITSPSKFAIYFDRMALDKLLSDKDNGLKVMPKIVQQKLRGLHQWLQTQQLEEVNLSQPNLLDLFNDKEMATALSAEGGGSAMHEHARAQQGTKDPQVSYPTFKGDQASWKNWDNKWWAFLCHQHNDDGIPLIYVIADIGTVEDEWVQDQCKGAKLSGKGFKNMDNFMVLQWLKLALADGSTYVYTRSHKGNGHLCYKELLKMYQNDAKEKNWLQELHEKVKNITYRGAKNFPFEKFGNALKTYYDEMAILGELVSGATQVQQMLNSIHHEPTK